MGYFQIFCIRTLYPYYKLNKGPRNCQVINPQFIGPRLLLLSERNTSVIIALEV